MKPKKKSWKVALFRKMEKSASLAKLVSWSVKINRPKPIVHMVIYFLFLRLLKANIDEADRKKVRLYDHVLDFFTRKLEPNARPIDKGQNFTSPADGKVIAAGLIEAQSQFEVKGATYQLEELTTLKGAGLKKFIGGPHMTIYLSPRDYHRVHMPYDGSLKKVVATGEGFLPVNDFSLENFDRVFSHNRRLVFFFENKKGSFILIMVGALNVGEISLKFDQAFSNTLREERQKKLEKKYSKLNLKKGEELATFCLGSTVILIGEKKTKPLFVQKIKKEKRPQQPNIKMGQKISLFFLNP